MTDPRRISFGGQVVEQCFRAASFDPDTPGTSLIESTPAAQRFDAVLLQNAWNVLPTMEFRDRLRPYPRRLRNRAWGRRLVALHNLRRANRVVCLTDAVAELAAKALDGPLVVAPVTAPIHDWRSAERELAVRNDFALVPGTLTWYKRPLAALEWLADSDPTIRRVVCCGRDDGSGCWPEVERRAAELGLTAERRVVPHEELYSLYARATVVILPSSLESLGLGLAEALLHANRVVASPIPAHVEVAGRVRRTPEWLPGSDRTGVAAVPDATRQISLTEATEEWRSAAEALLLTPLPGAKGPSSS